MERIRVQSGRVRGSQDDIVFDVLIALALADGRILSFGHAPRIFEGVCATLGKPELLGNPEIIGDRVVLE
jgi:hypothetical protein